MFGIGRSHPYVWIAREFVEGDSLAHLVAQVDPKALPDWHLAFRLAVHVARALYFIHQHHFLHRNVTPKNILFRAADNHIKLADMGLAKALSGSALRQMSMRTKIPEELPYMAPEQTQPNANLDPRTDIYSLGTVVYTLLTGKPPIIGKSSAETIAMVREVDPPEPRQWQPTMPEAFEAAVLKMLAKRPEDRFQDAGELLTELCQIAPDPG
jgi:serine/threonine protein kinase